MTILKRGSQGDDVTELQTNLTALAVECDIDGVFGAKTEAAVKHFQLGYGLEADGVAGPKTIKLIEEEVAKLEGNVPPSEADTTS